MRKKLLQPIGSENLKKITKWVDDNRWNPLAELHFYACVVIGGQSPCDVIPPEERYKSKYNRKIYNELWEIQSMAFDVRDAYGRLILERIERESHEV